MDRIDLRSDTVTLPSPGMRRAIADAKVGDDQYGEDPSVNRLQEEAAALLGTPAALFMPTGTMADQVAVRTLTHPGDDVVVPWQAHLVGHETGAAGAISGVQFSVVGGSDGRFTADDFVAAWKPPDHLLYPPTSLVVIENSHNRAGGTIFPQADVDAICAAARERGVASFLDGARLLNVAVATGRPASDLAAPFDLVSLSLSKGLGGPGGSVLAGSAELIGRARRFRRMLGGAMRQVGFLAAAGSYALQHNIERLADDHANARRLAEVLAASPTIGLDPAAVQTNIIVFELRGAPATPDAAAFVTACRERGVLLNAVGPRVVRAVTHLDVTTAQVERAGRIMGEVAAGR